MRRIVRLDVKRGFVIKGKRFEGFRKLGSFEEIVKRYTAESNIEFFFYDAVATLFGINSIPKLLNETLRFTFLPVCIGGGLHNQRQVEECISDGVDRVALNFMCFDSPDLVEKLVLRYGSQAVVGNVEARKIGGSWVAMHSTAREVGRESLLDHLKRLEQLGVSEIFLSAVDHDGMLNGFPNELLEKIDPFANVPYVLSGGLTQFEDQEVSNNFEFVKGIAISRALHEGLIKL